MNKKTQEEQTEYQQNDVDFEESHDVSGSYYNKNEALEYVTMTRDCYSNVKNIVWYDLEESFQYSKTKAQIKKIKEKNNNCRYLTRIYTGFYRLESGNFNPLDKLLLGVNIVALNGQNFDENLHEYIQFFTTRTGYRAIESVFTNTSPLKSYKIQIDQIYVPKKTAHYNMNIGFFRRNMEYQDTEEVLTEQLYIINGKNQTRMKEYVFQAIAEDYLYIELVNIEQVNTEQGDEKQGVKYRYSVMMKDIYVSRQSDIDTGTYQIAIMRVLKNHYWDGSFVKLRIVDNS